MRKFLLNLILGLLVTVTLFGKEITLLYTNDIHTQIEPFTFRGLDDSRKVGGFANITTFVKNTREEEKNKSTVLFLDAGDFFTGPPISSLTNGEAVIDIMNTMNYDAASIGNHEFDYGWENAQTILKKATFPLLLGNVFIEKTGEPFWDKPYTIIEKDGLTFGIIGIHGKFAFYDTIAAIPRKGIEARDEEEYLKKYIKELKEKKVDFIITLVHEGVPGKQSSFIEKDAARNLKKDIELAKNVEGIDVIVTGHAHQGTPTAIKVGKTLIVSTNARGAEVGELKITFNEKTKKIEDYENRLNVIYSDEIKADPKTQEVITKWNKKIEAITSEKIGTTSVPLTRSYATSSLLGNLFADAILDAATPYGGEIAVTNSGGLRVDIEKGNITYGHAIGVAPFPNEVVVFDLTGKDLKELFEHGADLTNGMLQVSSGFKVVYNPNKKTGEKVLEMSLNGKNIELEKTYRIAALDFLTNGGDGFETFLNKKNSTTIGGKMGYVILADYIKKVKTPSSNLDERVSSIK